MTNRNRRTRAWQAWQRYQDHYPGAVVPMGYLRAYLDASVPWWHRATVAGDPPRGSSRRVRIPGRHHAALAGRSRVTP